MKGIMITGDYSKFMREFEMGKTLFASQGLDVDLPQTKQVETLPTESESMVLTVLAGMTGITLAVFLLDAVEQGLSTPEAPVHFQIGFWEAVGACFLLLCLGLLAGLAPAYRAMSVKPIDAIRDE